MKKDFTPPRWAVIAKHLMKQKHLRQIDLAPCLGVTTRGAVGHYFRGRREPSIDQFLAMAKLLGVSVSELVGEIPLADSPASREIASLLEGIDDERRELLLRVMRAAVQSSEGSQLPQQHPDQTTKP